MSKNTGGVGGDCPGDAVPGKPETMATSSNEVRPASYWTGGGLVQGGPHVQRVASAMPWSAMGEYLPPLADGEVEIVMIGMHSTMGDVISVRARRDGDHIRYWVTDEYEEGEVDEDDEEENHEKKGVSRYDFNPRESTLPLTIGEVEGLLWSIRVDGWGQIFEKAWLDQSDGKELETFENDFYFIESDFYEGLQGWLEERFAEWKTRQLGL